MSSVFLQLSLGVQFKTKPFGPNSASAARHYPLLGLWKCLWRDRPQCVHSSLPSLHSLLMCRRATLTCAHIGSVVPHPPASPLQCAPSLVSICRSLKLGIARPLWQNFLSIGFLTPANAGVSILMLSQAVARFKNRGWGKKATPGTRRLCFFMHEMLSNSIKGRRLNRGRALVSG